MDNKLLASRLREMATNSGTLNCLGCGYENSCGTRGCAVLKKAAEIVESAHKWISVKDRLPEPCVDVLVYYESGLIDTGWRFYDGTFCFDGTLDYGNVTHWMPLPEPPFTGKDDVDNETDNDKA